METKSIDYKELLHSTEHKLTGRENEDFKATGDSIKEKQGKRRDIAFEKIPHFIGEKLKIERGNIDFESPPDFDEPTGLTLEVRIQNLEKKQDQIILMLQQLGSRIPKFSGYLTMQEACKKFETTEQEMHKRMHWFLRTNQRPVDMRGSKGQRLFNEKDLVEAMLLDIGDERKRQLKMQSLTSAGDNC